MSCVAIQRKRLSEHCGQLLGNARRAASLAEPSVWAQACSPSGLRAAAGIAAWICRGWWRSAHSHQELGSV